MRFGNAIGRLAIIIVLLLVELITKLSRFAHLPTAGRWQVAAMVCSILGLGFLMLWLYRRR
jgi:heme/copper-type cytochrome/quinol oxidase subunit 4